MSIEVNSLPDNVRAEIIGYLPYHKNDFIMDGKYIVVFSDEILLLAYTSKAGFHTSNIEVKKVRLEDFLNAISAGYDFLIDAGVKELLSKMLSSYGLGHLVSNNMQESVVSSSKFYTFPVHQSEIGAGKKQSTVESITQGPETYYRDKFKEAQILTKERNIEDINFKFISGSCLYDVMPLIQRKLIATDMSDIALKCNIISEQTCDLIRKNTSHDAVVTTGTIISDNKDLFSSLNTFDEDFVNRVCAEGDDALKGVEYSYHTWVTLDTMEVIDMTFAASFEQLHGEGGKSYFKVMAKHPRDFIGGIFYKPVLLGCKFFEKHDSTRYNNIKDIVGAIFKG